MTNKKGRTQAAINTTFYDANYNSPAYEFAGAIFYDIGANIDPIADGEIHRFDDPEGRPGNKACWYVLHINGIPAGSYGNWRTGFQKTWRANHTTPETLNHQALQKKLLQKKQQRQQDKTDKQQWAAKRAAMIWQKAKPVFTNQGYIQSKNIPAIGLRESDNRILVPIIDIFGTLKNLQFISNDGTKRFLTGGQITGCFFLAGTKSLPNSGTMYLCEGMATGMTVWQHTKQPVACALNAGNLLPVSKAIKSQHPQLNIIIAADNDHKTPGNPGITKAQDAAKFTGAGITWPESCGQNCFCTDFNDLANCQKGNR
jgi:putative DNA primase/helicase